MKTTDEFDELLNSLDGIQRAKAPADFQRKLEQRLRFLPAQTQPNAKLIRYALAAMITLALLNGSLLYAELTSNDSSQTEASMIEATYYYETSLY